MPIFVTIAFADHLPLELREGEQNVQHQPAHARRGVEGLSYGDERHFVPIEDPDRFGKAHQRPAEAVDLVDPFRLSIREQTAKRRAFQGAPE
jgi:hypothetical protein